MMAWQETLKRVETQFGNKLILGKHLPVCSDSISQIVLPMIFIILEDILKDSKPGDETRQFHQTKQPINNADETINRVILLQWTI